MITRITATVQCTPTGIPATLPSPTLCLILASCQSLLTIQRWDGRS
jgi:hypothetical protein